MTQYIPTKFNIEQHLLNYPPTEIKKLSQDKLLHVLSLIVSIPAKNKGFKFANGFVTINAKKLMQEIGRDYALYLNYLTETGVLEEDGHYIVGEKSTCYRLTAKYRGSFREVACSDKQIAREKNKNWKQKKELFQQDVYKRHKHLFNWLESDLLQLYMDASQAFLNHLILQGTRLHTNSRERVQQRQTAINRSNRSGSGKREKLTRRERKIHKYYSTLQAAQRLANFKFKSSFKIDDKAGRLHTPLTGLKKELRNFLTFGGKRLVEIDIKNSQPFFSLVLLQSSFWTEKKTGRKKSRQISILCSCVIKDNDNMTLCKCLTGTVNETCEGNTGTITYEKLLNEGKLTHDIYQCLRTGQYNTMIEELVEDIDNEEYKSYRDMVIDGTLYEVLLQRYVEKTGRTDMDRDKMKKVMFTILFSENEKEKIEKEKIEKESIKQLKIRQQREKAKDLFRDIFPTIYRVFEYLKEDNNAVLACLLQTIEAHVMLDKVCRRIKHERPSLPLYTVHDSILTTEGNEAYVRMVMEQEFMKRVGAVPGMTVKLLSPKNLQRQSQIVG